ncbi:MAG: hypothetical protein DRO11_00140 [Methanobacteriota archaeon]|nr:MAG: hypothetical protein DRO11_00140 [Euryarchaeota archaeon]
MPKRKGSIITVAAKIPPWVDRKLEEIVKRKRERGIPTSKSMEIRRAVIALVEGRILEEKPRTEVDELREKIIRLEATVQAMQSILAGVKLPNVEVPDVAILKKEPAPTVLQEDEDDFEEPVEIKIPKNIGGMEEFLDNEWAKILMKKGRK